MSDTATDNYREAVDRITWAHSNLDTETRARVLRETAAALEADESRFESMPEHIRHILSHLGYRLPESVDE